MSSSKFAVVGAGNGGQAFAGHLAAMGHHVSLFDVDAQRVAELDARGTIELVGAVSANGRPERVTGDLGAAVADADVIMIVVPACYQESLAERMAPYLGPTQAVVLNPGATGGALALRRIFRDAGVSDDLSVSETGTLLYACRAESTGRVRVFAIKDAVDLATLPARHGSRVLEILSEPFPAFVPAASVLHTSLGNLNPMVHPAPTLLNLGRIETGQRFEFYREGMTPTVAKIVEALDRERLEIASAFNTAAPSLQESLRTFYGATEATLFEIFRNSRAHEGVMAPSNIDSRYLFEDVPTGLVPLAALAEAASIETPTIRAVADLACAVSGRDYWKEGRTLDRLGLAGCSVEQIRSAC